jgi:hypothetical protein
MAEMLLTWCKTTITYSLFIGSPVFEDDSPSATYFSAAE